MNTHEKHLKNWMVKIAMIDAIEKISRIKKDLGLIQDKIYFEITVVVEENEKLKNQLKQTQDRLKDAESVIEFYADDNVYRSKHGGHIQNKNFHSKIGQDCGKRAREYFKKYGESDE